MNPLEFEQYLPKLLEDFNLKSLPEDEQKKAIEILRDRFDQVVIDTMVLLASNEQKDRLLEALKKDENVDEAIIDISSTIPNLQEALEMALAGEYESLKEAMQVQ